MSFTETSEVPNQQNNYWFYINALDKKPKKSTNVAIQKKEREEKYILCSHCENKITLPKFKLEIEGAFDHTFLNPEGYVFHIGCFEQANGCAVFGDAISEWSWFPGFGWRAARCNQCLKQLGWFYTSDVESTFFFGLILDNLI